MLVLEGRGLRPSDEQRAKIEACRDTDLLDHWLSRAPTVASIDALLESHL